MNRGALAVAGERRGDNSPWRLPRGWIDGLILSNDAGDLNNYIGVAPGVARSTRNKNSTLVRDQRDIEIAYAQIKQLNVDWAIGNGGLRYAGAAIANGSYHIFGIGGAGRKDSIFGTASVDPIAAGFMPAGYTAFRMIMSIERTGGNIDQFTQTDDYVRWKTPTLDVTSGGLGATPVLFSACHVPAGLSVRARFNVSMVQTGANDKLYIWNPSDTASAPSATVAPLGTSVNSVANIAQLSQAEIVTDTAKGVMAATSGSSSDFRAATIGYFHPRGRNA